MDSIEIPNDLHATLHSVCEGFDLTYYDQLDPSVQQEIEQSCAIPESSLLTKKLFANPIQFQTTLRERRAAAQLKNTIEATVDVQQKPSRRRAADEPNVARNDNQPYVDRSEQHVSDQLDYYATQLEQSTLATLKYLSSSV
jgi:hypothetical protein